MAARAMAGKGIRGLGKAGEARCDGWGSMGLKLGLVWQAWRGWVRWIRSSLVQER